MTGDLLSLSATPGRRWALGAAAAAHEQAIRAADGAREVASPVAEAEVRRMQAAIHERAVVAAEAAHAHALKAAADVEAASTLRIERTREAAVAHARAAFDAAVARAEASRAVAKEDEKQTGGDKTGPSTTSRGSSPGCHPSSPPPGSADHPDRGVLPPGALAQRGLSAGGCAVRP